jgi:serine/threonine protein kinase/TolB-like protein/Flp pilus assembly protein TadD
MTPERFKQIEELYHAALERGREVLANVDPELRREVESLLAPGGTVLDRPPWESATTLSMVAPVAAGTEIGWYRIESQIGEGGMGVVYRAADTKLNRPVAIKFLSDELADAAARRRFQREAKTASSLNHPHIVTVYDVGEIDGRQYIVTEYIDGGTLREWSKEPRTCRQIVELLIGVADGLAVAHEARILHRDVKPGNILITKSGYAKLADFGLAKLIEAEEADITQTLTARRTRVGAIVGTIPYMSPEQALGRPTDARSDIFSFGVVLYEMLAGCRPFAGATDAEILQGIIHGTPQVPGECTPLAVRSVVEKTLEKDPADRYQSMRELVVDLRRIARQADAPAVAAPPSQASATAPQLAKSESAVPRRVLPAYGWAAAAVGVLLLIGAWFAWPGSASAHIRSIAVLPLQNLSGDRNQQYFSDGITEALLSDLAQIQALKVISRTSVMRYRDTTKSMPAIGRELGVDAIVEGSVQRVGDRVRISAQLIQASTDAHLWAKDYEREVADVLELEADVARSIAQEIRIQLSPEESKRIAGPGRVDPAAQEEFLLGSYSRWRLKTEDLKQAIQHFERAVQIQPDFAAAYAGLSGAWAELGTRESVEPARAAARKALELDPQLSEAHSALARMSMTADWDWAGAEQGFRRALELNPNSLEYCQCISDLLSGMGRFGEARAILERGEARNPLSSPIHAALGRTLLWGRQYSEALTHLHKAIELDPQNGGAYLFLAETHEGTGDFASALTELREYLNLRGVEPEQSPLTGRLYAKLGRRSDALRVLANVTRPGSSPNLRDLATLYFALGDTDRGFEALTKAFDGRQDLLRVNVSALFDGVREDARFRGLIARLHLPNGH